MSSDEKGRVGQNMELLDWSAVRGELELVDGVLLLPVDVLEIGLIEVKGVDGLVRHQTGGLCDVFVDIEKEELVLGKHYYVVADFLYLEDAAVGLDNLHQTPVFLQHKHKLCLSACEYIMFVCRMMRSDEPIEHHPTILPQIDKYFHLCADFLVSDLDLADPGATVGKYLSEVCVLVANAAD